MNDEEFEQQVQEYYDRKLKRAEEVIPYLAWMFFALVAWGAVFMLWHFVAWLWRFTNG